MDIDITQKKLVVFDMDDTITPSKSPIGADMAELLLQLSRKVFVGVVSGGKHAQFEKQLLQYLSPEIRNEATLYIGPTSGAQMYHVGEVEKKIHGTVLPAVVMREVEDAYFSSAKEVGIVFPEITYGSVFEERDGTQISFSPFGQEAPYEVKKDWDRDRGKRLAIREKMLPKIQQYGLDVLIGGVSTMDVVAKGVNKAYFLDKLVEHLGIKKEDVLYVGDAVFPGGNDYAPKEAGYDCINVESIKETKGIIEHVLISKK